MSDTSPAMRVLPEHVSALFVGFMKGHKVECKPTNEDQRGPAFECVLPDGKTNFTVKIDESNEHDWAGMSKYDMFCTAYRPYQLSCYTEDQYYTLKNTEDGLSLDKRASMTVRQLRDGSISKSIAEFFGVVQDPIQ